MLSIFCSLAYIVCQPSIAEIKSEILRQGGNQELIRIAEAESSFKVDAINYNKDGTTDFGLFQENSIHGLSQSYLKDYRNAIKEAIKLYTAQGNTPWRASKSKWYE